MNRKTLGAALVAATALVAAETGCQTAEEKAAIQTANGALSKLADIQESFRAVMEDATNGRFDPNVGMRFEFVTPHASTNGVHMLSRVFCRKPASDEAVRSLTTCKLQTFRVAEPSDKIEDVPLLSQPVEEISIGEQLVMTDGEVKDKATVQSDVMLGETKVVLNTEKDNKECRVDDTEVPNEICERFLSAVRRALDATIDSAKRARDKLAMKRKFHGVTDTSAATGDDTPGAGQPLDESPPQAPTTLKPGNAVVW